MADVQVTCINKQNHNSTHEGITHLGGAGWKLTRQEAINLIRDYSNVFYIFVNGNKAYLKIVRGPHGEYVQSYVDGKPTANLLALPECSSGENLTIGTRA